MDLKVGTAEKYGRRFPKYNLPLEIGFYSSASDRMFSNDNHELKYLAMPDKLTDLYLDLNDGYRDIIRKDPSEHKSHRLLKWIISNEEQARKHFSNCRPSDSKLDFICSRGLLRQISSTIYENRDDWQLYATKFRSVIYLQKVKTELHNKEVKYVGKRGKGMTSWGFKFEQYMTSDQMNSKPNTSVPVNENVKYFTVVKVKLDNHRILMTAKVDAADPEHFKKCGHDPTSMLRYVELKTSRIINTESQKRSLLRYKLLKWYLQSYFVGIPRVICGFRDGGGIVRKLHSFNVRDMPNMAEGLWSPAPCLNFCSYFLDYVKKCVVKDDPRVVYNIYRKPGSDITCEELPPENQFLPDWYIESDKVI